MAWLHSWAGLVVGWMLFAVFVTGTASYYRTDISRWMRPELAAYPVTDAGRAADLAVTALRTHAQDARQWFVRLPGPSDPSIGLQWRGRGGMREILLLDPSTGAPARVRDTLGGDFLYRFHYELHMPPLWGRWLVGTATMAMLVTLISGVVTHRRIFTDFFTFRPQKGGRRAWLDAHNILGVLALPYHLMIAYSGLVLLTLTVMPWGLVAAYRGDAPRFAQELGVTATSPRPATGQPAPLAALAPMIAEATGRTGAAPEHLVIDKPGDAGATVTVLTEPPPGLAHRHPQVAFDGVSGVVLSETGAPRPVALTYFTLSGLHQADFASVGLRLLYALCGVMGAAMVATGLILWTRAREPALGRNAAWGLRLVRVLNVGTIVGLPLGIAAYFLANRLLPIGLDDRAAWEVRAFFAVWILIAIVAIAIPHASVWRLTLFGAGLTYAAIPCVDMLMIGRIEPTFLAFDAVMLGVGLISLYACACIGRPWAGRPILSRLLPHRAAS